MLATVRFFIESFLSTAFDACDITLRERVHVRQCVHCAYVALTVLMEWGIYLYRHRWLIVDLRVRLLDLTKYISNQFGIEHCMATHTHACIKTIFHRADMRYFVSVHNFIAPVRCFVAIFRKRIVSWVVDNNAKSLSVYKIVCAIPSTTFNSEEENFCSQFERELIYRATTTALTTLIA